MKLLLPAAFVVALACPTALRAQDPPVRPGPGIVPPKPVKQVQRGYTDAALRTKISGDVLIEAVVSTTGAVSDARVIKSLDQTYGLDDAALAAAKQWRFEPGTRDGTPIPVIVTMLLEFRKRHASAGPIDTRDVRPRQDKIRSRYASSNSVLSSPGTPGLVPPKVMKAVEAKYPSDAMREKTQGDVKVDVVVQPERDSQPGDGDGLPEVRIST